MVLQVPKGVHSLLGNSIKEEVLLTQLLPLGSCHGAPVACSSKMTRSTHELIFLKYWIEIIVFFLKKKKGPMSFTH